MSDWSFWKGFISGAALTFLLALLKGAALRKSILPRRAKPQILDAQDCWVRPKLQADNREKIVFALFDLLVNNTGSKDCSVISVELLLPGGSFSDCEYTPCLPITISPGRTERIKVFGHADKPNKLWLQPKQQSVEATAFVKFNTGKIIKKKISFIIKRY